MSRKLPPPPKPDLRPVPATDKMRADERVQFNVRISAEHARYIRMLAAATGKQPGQVLERAIALLRKTEGEM